MANIVILGIHSNVLGSASYTDGHAWITVNRNGITKYYGLWPDGHPATPNNGAGWDIRTGMERNSKPKASRYYKLSVDQTKVLDQLLLRNITWGYTNNCSSWAHDIIWKARERGQFSYHCIFSSLNIDWPMARPLRVATGRWRGMRHRQSG